MMLPSVTLASSFNHHNTSSTVINRVYWIRAKSADNNPRQNRVSTKILGFGVFMIGVVVLSISLIMGLQFPTHIKEKILKDVCILNKDHEFYEKWTQDSSYVRYNRVYHWHINNPVAFLQGLPPIFSQKGPYIYLERRRRLNVMFQNNLIAYHTMFTQSFSRDHTHSECGNECSEQDNVTTINLEFLKKVHFYGGMKGYLKAYLRTYIVSLLGNWTDPKTGNHQGLLDIFTCLSGLCSNTTSSKTNITALNQFSFGKYVELNDSVHKATILQSNVFVNASEYINISFIRTMYKHLSIVEYSSPVACTIPLKQYDVSWRLMWSTQVLNDTTTPLPTDQTEQIVYLANECGVVDALTILYGHLTKFSNMSGLRWTFSECEKESKTCDNMDETYESFLALVSVAKRFADIHLLSLISDMLLRQPGNSIIHTINQQKLTKGYIRQKNNLDPYSVEKVKGILSHHKDIEDAFRNTPGVVAGTCLLHGDNKNNMFVKGYNGSQFAPPGVYQKVNARVCGYQMDFPPSGTCRACVSPVSVNNKYDVFLRELHRSVSFQYATEVQKYDTRLFSYTLSMDSFREQSCNLINTTAIYGYPSFMGMPAFHGSGCTYPTRQLISRSTNFNSLINIEPRTGKVWSQSIKLQTSAVIPPELLTGPSGHLAPATSTMPLPLNWVDRRADIVQHDVDYFDFKIDRLMKVSCGGLIGLATMSFLIMILSVFVGVFSNRKNKVSDVPQPPSSPNKTQSSR